MPFACYLLTEKDELIEAVGLSRICVCRDRHKKQEVRSGRSAQMIAIVGL
jgi:hypothetical protein